jgi:hypothetical protein
MEKGYPNEIPLKRRREDTSRMFPFYDRITDSWYSSKKILKRIEDYRWGFISQLKKNRKSNESHFRKYKLYPYWHGIPWIRGGLKKVFQGRGASSMR